MQQMELTGQTACVTGVSGFLGFHLAQELLSAGATVVGIDKARNPTLMKKFEGKAEFIFVEDDIQKVNDSSKWLDKADIVVHLAGLAIPKVCNSDPDLAMRINVDGTKEILSHSLGAKRFIFASTGMVYGDQDEIPIRETATTSARDVYALTKLIGENLCKIYHYRYGLPFTILRFGNSYGPSQAKDYLIPSLMNQGLSEGKIEVWDAKPIRDFIYVKDVVEAIVSILKTEVTCDEILNVGTGRGCSTKEIAEIISRQLSVPWVEINRKQDVPAKLVLDIAKVKSLTGWSPRFSHQKGLEATVADCLQSVGGSVVNKVN